MMSLTDALFRCIACSQTYPADRIRYRCDCGQVLTVLHQHWDKPEVRSLLTRTTFDQRLGSRTFPYDSGVWRFHELLAPVATQHIISKPEGNTNLYAAGRAEKNGQAKVGMFAGINQLYLKHEGENPTGSFKDRGMTTGISVARALGAQAVACASTGNTSASLASYAAKAGIRCFIFLPKQNISAAKLSQTLAYGATTIALDGDFDACMHAVEQVSLKHQIYLLNSINPFRVEGQKSIVFELLQQLEWHPPDWIIVPGGNLGNASALGKGLLELRDLGLIHRVPKLAVIQAAGANPFYQSFQNEFRELVPITADTIATAIRIGNPVSFLRAKEIIRATHGVVADVTDQEILAAKVVIDQAGIGCEPGSATTVAGLKKLIAAGTIAADDQVVCILTGHILKDPQASTLAHQTAPIEASQKTVEQTVARLLQT